MGQYPNPSQTHLLKLNLVPLSFLIKVDKLIKIFILVKIFLFVAIKWKGKRFEKKEKKKKEFLNLIMVVSFKFN